MFSTGGEGGKDGLELADFLATGKDHLWEALA
jgi:hypothetical protein